MEIELPPVGSGRSGRSLEFSYTEEIGVKEIINFPGNSLLSHSDLYELFFDPDR